MHHLSGDLLGCICLVGGKCLRNCRIENMPFVVPEGAKLHTVNFNPKEISDGAHLAWKRVEEEEEERNIEEIVGLEAWSSGLICFWTAGPCYAVAVGTEKGKVFSSWEACKASTQKKGRCVYRKFHAFRDALAWLERSKDKEKEIPGAPRVVISVFKPQLQLDELILALNNTQGPLNVIFTKSDYCVNSYNYYEPSAHLEQWTQVTELTKDRNICLKLEQ